MPQEHSTNTGEKIHTKNANDSDTQIHMYKQTDRVEDEKHQHKFKHVARRLLAGFASRVIYSYIQETCMYVLLVCGKLCDVANTSEGNELCVAMR